MSSFTFEEEKCIHVDAEKNRLFKKLLVYVYCMIKDGVTILLENSRGLDYAISDEWE